MQTDFPFGLRQNVLYLHDRCDFFPTQKIGKVTESQDSNKATNDVVWIQEDHTENFTNLTQGSFLVTASKQSPRIKDRSKMLAIYTMSADNGLIRGNNVGYEVIKNGKQRSLVVKNAMNKIKMSKCNEHY